MKDFIIEQDINMLYKNGIRFISGKWFHIYNKVEITQKIRSYIAKACNLFKERDIKEVMEAFRLRCGEEEFEWIQLPIVTDALRLGPIDDLNLLPFPLDDKQLIIINRLLFHPEDEIMFITTGVGGSGKSTFLNIVKQLFDNDVSATTLDQLSNDFLLTEAVKHRLIASDELAKGELNMMKLKTLISKQRITCNPKHEASYDIQSQSALFYCCNTPPKIDITDTGILRRIVYYFRNTKIQNPDKSLNKKTFTYDQLLTIARIALSKEIYNDDDAWLTLFEQETHINLVRNNSVYIYYQSVIENSEMTYENYKLYCQQKGLKPYSEPNYDDIKDLIIDQWKMTKNCENLCESVDVF